MWENSLTEAIAIGIVISVLFANITGFYPGGIIVPGYIALYLDRPLSMVVTFAVSFLVYLIVRVLSYKLIIYGRRKTAIAILLGFGFKLIWDILSPGNLGGGMEMGQDSLNVIGYVIPGLIANNMESYGWVEALSSVIIGSVLVKLILILVS
ncbi:MULTISPECIES: poly-gamma-glutamate biosynthesis protein PgsC [unclassified Moorena]|uniref:poly-gamma-glutamate biosynthesis protein PgsC n=1 Tax=unclassified Moorena TaxID=2683338 RepID=UPI0013C72873|nr:MULTISPECIES: poly-gamma-glutamate biosynthesis protein PgsC [unclassified Moorena]NEO18609.1 poly-gamma-glutamate biosynthesis protein PgsC [Moorena sp. SIO4A5]NEP23217.1 poly-gamma-glutamate biosynthesis protein PgsC [Moorena sp. SIO3I6]NEQ56431.1 poly-gamma-glutamate biosynthesis protein PgsC [Moorena sp. SIO4A1]